jgi:transposase InsO family protein
MRRSLSLPPPSATDELEAIALHRVHVIGVLVGRDFAHGELRRELRALRAHLWRPPGSAVMRRYSVPTLERWYYAYLHGGLQALKPQQRSDRGRGRALTEEQRQLLLDIRSEYPTASAATIIETLVRRLVVAPGSLTVCTVNRFYNAQGMPRRARNGSLLAEGQRLRWEAERPGTLWHSDVCHGHTLTGPSGETSPIRIHAILDDASRHVVALEVHTREREEEMLGVFARALLRAGKPGTLYLDNGSTYTGDGLKTVCARLGVRLVHATPYDPRARGKMERFWRTLRDQCLNFIPPTGTVHDVQVRLNAWLDARYSVSPHAALMGGSPGTVWLEHNVCKTVTSTELKETFWTQIRRTVRADSTISVDGVIYQVDAAYLASKTVDVVFHLPPLDVDHPPQIRVEDRLLPLHPVNPKANATTPRAPAPKPVAQRTPSAELNPAQAVLDQVAGRIRPRTKS